MIRTLGFLAAGLLLSVVSYAIASPPFWYAIMATMAIVWTAASIEKLTRKTSPVV